MSDYCDFGLMISGWWYRIHVITDDRGLYKCDYCWSQALGWLILTMILTMSSTMKVMTLMARNWWLSEMGIMLVIEKLWCFSFGIKWPSCCIGKLISHLLTLYFFLSVFVDQQTKDILARQSALIRKCDGNPTFGFVDQQTDISFHISPNRKMWLESRLSTCLAGFVDLLINRQSDLLLSAQTQKCDWNPAFLRVWRVLWTCWWTDRQICSKMCLESSFSTRLPGFVDWNWAHKTPDTNDQVAERNLFNFNVLLNVYKEASAGERW